MVAGSAPADGGEAGLFFATLDHHFRHLRSFAPPLLAALRFGSPRAGTDLLEALDILATMNAPRRVQAPPSAPVSFIPQRWAPAVVRPDGVDRHNGEACVLHAARGAVRAGDLTVAGSRRYLPWDADLYTPAAWSARRTSWMEERGLPTDGAAYVTELLDELDTVTAQVARRLERGRCGWRGAPTSREQNEEDR